MTGLPPLACTLASLRPAYSRPRTRPVCRLGGGAVTRSSVNVTTPTGEPRGPPATPDGRKLIFFDIDNCLCKQTGSAWGWGGCDVGEASEGGGTLNSAGLRRWCDPTDSKQCGIEKQMKYLIGAYFRKVSTDVVQGAW